MRALLIAAVLLVSNAWAAGCNEHYCTEEDSRETHADIYVRSVSKVPLVVTVNVTVENALPTVFGPVTVYANPGERKKALRVVRTDRAKPWRYNYTTTWKLAAPVADSLITDYVYRVPLALGTSVRVLQGEGGSFSHYGADQYGMDLDVPVGTIVYAARGGVVVNAKGDSDEGGAGRDMASKANFVIVQHVDGTYGRYYHLQKNGVKVRIGQQIREGDIIGLSGATGWAAGPHLHFDVAKMQGASFETVPFTMNTAQGALNTFATGQTITAK